MNQMFKTEDSLFETTAEQWSADQCDESNVVAQVLLSSYELDSLTGAFANLRVDVERIAKELRFNDLAETWKEETGFWSNVTKRSMHPAYQQIIGMGERAVPFILADLETNGPDDWFWALTAITGLNPITEDIAGMMSEMTEAWLQWGRKEGYLKDYPQHLSES